MFTDNEWNHLHDVVLNATWKTTKTKMSREELQSLFNELPDDIKSQAYNWGLSDTLVRESIHTWYIKNK